jgi:NADPH2:quinone reductase
VFWGAYREREPDDCSASIAELLQLWERGDLRPHVSARYPLENAMGAISDLADRRAEGKVAVVIREGSD